jgi:hypothetical protein
MKKLMPLCLLVGLVFITFVILNEVKSGGAGSGLQAGDLSDSSSSRFERANDVRLDGITQESCVAAGGAWNPCGSACRTTPESPCIEVCVEYCECASDAQCPSGLTCIDVVDDVGVCL